MQDAWYWITHSPQRIRYGFTDKDTYNLDDTIAKFILPRLKRFKILVEEHGGVPGSILTKKQLESNNISDEAHNKAHNKWLEIIDTMIMSFEMSLNTYEYKNDIKKYQEYYKKVNKGLNYFGKYFQDLWW